MLSHPAQAASGLSLSLENLFAPLGKRVERVTVTPTAGTEGAPATETITRGTGFGRETTEFIGVSGFFDLNRNWRVLYGIHGALVGRPIFKLDGSLAFMLDMPDDVPLQPYFFLGGTPVIATDPAFPPIGLTAHAGMGVDYTWNNTLYTAIRLNTYLATLYGEEINNNLNIEWKATTFSLSASMGYLF